MAQSSDYLLVAAIDFGTTYSGYAFSMRDTFTADPLKIHANQAWNSGGKQFLSLKTPTCLLLNAKKEFVAFGYEAENKYVELAMDDEHEDYFYFHRFKMNLYNKKISSEMNIEDIRGKPMIAIEVFAHSIKALKDHLLKSLDKQGTGVRTNEIRWVLTVPAIWDEKAKQFMRKSAIQAGISKKNLLLSLEPEASSIFCQFSPTERSDGIETKFTISDVGSKYMIVDLGGGTADITVHERIGQGRLKELCKASGAGCGGTSVDTEFIQMLTKIVGAPLINMLKREQPEAYVDLIREFETVKRTITPEKTGKINMSIPFAAINELCKQHLREEFTTSIASSPFKDSIKTRGDKLRIEASLFKELFKKTIDNIIEQVKTILKVKEASGITQILLVGGFGECELVQVAIQQQFKSQRVIVPNECGLAVLKGAVLFGHDPYIIGSRYTRFTYGISVCRDFNPAIHDEKYSYIDRHSGTKKCDNLFGIIMKKDTEVKAGTKVSRSYRTLLNEKKIFIRLFATENKNTRYVDEEGCVFMGESTITIEDLSGKGNIDVDYVFGNTELSLTAVERSSGNQCELEVNLV